MEHDHQRQDGTPAGPPRHPGRDRRRARAGAIRAAAERDHQGGQHRHRRAAAHPRDHLARARSSEPQGAARSAARRAAAGAARRPRRAVGARRRRARGARRAGFDHHQMQGRDPGRSSAARRVHHRRLDRAQAHQRGRPHRRGRPRRGRAAAQALALRNPRACAVLDPERRRVGAGGARGRRRPQGVARAARRTGAGRERLGRGRRQDVSGRRERRARRAVRRPVAAARHGGRARGLAA